jgi:hypothetical protein
MVVSLLPVTNHAVKRALPEVVPARRVKLMPLRAAANNLSRCEKHFRAFAVIRLGAVRGSVLNRP